MKKKLIWLPPLLLLITLFLSACSGLLPLDEEPVTGTFGPDYSEAERQMRTFDVLWKNIEDTYIYYDSAAVNWDELHDRYTGEINDGLSNDEFVDLLKGLESDLPEGSFAYQSRSERVESDVAASTTLEGIGAIVGFEEEKQPHIVILQVIAGSPAEAAGLQPHDSIFAIDGSPISIEEGLDAVKRIRGPASSTVKLAVQSPGEQQRSIEVRRAKITGIPKLEAYDVVGTDFGHLLFPPAEYQGFDQDVFNSLQTLSLNRELKGLILDLRIAGSSPNWPIDTFLTIFDDGTIGDFYNRNQQSTLKVTGQDVVGSQTIPLVILVGKNTKGFAEIFAAALQKDKRAVIVGEPTPGAVETQSAFYLPDGSRAFIESTSFRLANGDELGTTGVIPDVEVPTGWDEISPNNDPVLTQALQILESTK